MPKATGFAVGDLVQLKSGGPIMTVERTGLMDRDIRCQWFGGKKLESGDFPPESLKPATLEEKK